MRNHNFDKVKREQLDCEWCPRTDVKGYRIHCNFGCYHYICLRCISKLKCQVENEGVKEQ